ncbi:hypothetical protein QQF64_004199 [Cirrhinus molitorella]|uniref:Uncharacterized protein n=1 Tax=Cirrhinus molitorella TaxID=172907 RepID=A0ABR3MIQ2_9TELE
MNKQKDTTSKQMKTTLSSNAARWEAGVNVSRAERERIRIYFGLLRFLGFFRGKWVDSGLLSHCGLLPFQLLMTAPNGRPSGRNSRQRS